MRKTLYLVAILFNCLFMGACSCSKVDVNVENGKVVTEGNIKNGDKVKIECVNPHTFGYWYTEEGKPLSSSCVETFTVSNDVTFKVKEFDHFIIAGIKQTLGGETVTLPKNVEYSELESTFYKNNKVSDYARFSLADYTTTTNLKFESVTYEDNIYYHNYSLKLYVPSEYNFYRTYRAVATNDGYLLVEGAGLSQNAGIVINKNDNTSIVITVTLSNKSSDSYIN